METVEYVLPAVHAVHVVAPVPVVPVTEPAEQTAQEVSACALAGAATYWPAGQALPHDLSAEVVPPVWGYPALHAALCAVQDVANEVVAD